MKPSKRAITRARVIQAAIDCIYEEGFHDAHTNRIAARADVSWGVIQYHFVDKDGLLQAVIEEIFRRFAASLDHTRFTEEDLSTRIRQMIDVIWTIFNQREYRVSVAILRNAGLGKESSIEGKRLLEDWASKTSRLWEQIFADQAHDPANSETARRLLFAALRGLADDITAAVSVPGAKRNNELDALTRAITHLLCSGKSA